MAYFTLLIAGFVLVLYLHAHCDRGTLRMLGLEDFRSNSCSREEDWDTKNAWDRSKSKGELGYYQGHQMTGGYKDGLSGDDYKMNGPRKLNSEEREKLRLRKNARGPEAPIGSSTSADIQGKRISTYAWEDAEDVVKIYIDSLPGCESWADAKIPKEGAKLQWQKTNSVTLLLKNVDESEKYFLHIPALYSDAKDVTLIWKRKRLLIKIIKRVRETWAALEKVSSQNPI